MGSSKGDMRQCPARTVFVWNVKNKPMVSNFCAKSPRNAMLSHSTRFGPAKRAVLTASDVHTASSSLCPATRSSTGANGARVSQPTPISNPSQLTVEEDPPVAKERVGYSWLSSALKALLVGAERPRKRCLRPYQLGNVISFRITRKAATSLERRSLSQTTADSLSARWRRIVSESSSMCRSNLEILG